MSGVQIIYQKYGDVKFYIKPGNEPLVNPKCSGKVADFLGELNRWTNQKPSNICLTFIQLICVVSVLACIRLSSHSSDWTYEIAAGILIIVSVILFIIQTVREVTHIKSLKLIVSRFQAKLSHFYAIDFTVSPEKVEKQSLAAVFVLRPVASNQGYVQPIQVVNQP